MGRITYVRGAGSPVAIILCYFLEKNNYLFHNQSSVIFETISFLITK